MVITDSVNDMEDFKTPNIYQDLLHIHGLIGISEKPNLTQRLDVSNTAEEPSDSSDNDVASEDEIEADLKADLDDYDPMDVIPTYDCNRFV